MNELTLVEMETCPDDVAINILGPYEFDLLSIYERVRDSAKTFARNKELTTGKKFLVEMSRNQEGYPTADAYCEGKVVYRIFATKKTALESIESKSYTSAVGDF